VISAGSIMHILIAIVLLFGVYSTQGEITADSEPRVIVATASQTLPAWAAGIRDGDEIVSIEGLPVTSPVELGETVRSFEPGEVVDIVVIRDGDTLNLPVGLGANTSVPEDDPLFGSALLGVSSGSPPLYQSTASVARPSTPSPTSSRCRGSRPRASSRCSTRSTSSTR
jgi:membrane-associated protease RseP (regulator of RpoE activity)